MDGEVRVESEVGTGSTFIVSLPLPSEWPPDETSGSELVLAAER